MRAQDSNESRQLCSYTSVLGGFLLVLGGLDACAPISPRKSGGGADSAGPVQRPEYRASLVSRQFHLKKTGRGPCRWDAGTPICEPFHALTTGVFY